jgi:hypothetical protein
MTVKPVPISDARKLGEASGARGIVIVAVGDDGKVAATSWGRSMADCRALASLLDAEGHIDLACDMDAVMGGLGLPIMQD